MKAGSSSCFRRVLSGFILMDRDVIPYHCASGLLFCTGLLCLITTVIQVLEICGIPCWNPMDLADSIVERYSLSQAFSFLGVLVLMVFGTVCSGLIFTLVERNNRSYFDRIPISIRNRLAQKTILFVLCTALLMIATGFIGVALR